MTNREKEILELIKLNPFITQEEIASKLRIARSSVAIHITNLMKKGYILGRGYIVNENKYVVVIGGSNIDITGYPKNKLLHRDSNPGYVNLSLGGVGRNIAENISRLDIHVKLITAFGNDIYGQKIINHSKNLGIDISNSLFSTINPTSTYLAILNENRDMEIAISHMDICDEITADFLNTKSNIIKNSSLIILDTNVPKESIKYILDNYDIPVFLDPVSASKTHKIKDIIGKFHTIKPNLLEAEILTDIKINNENDAKKACEKLLSKGVKQVFLTMGEKGVISANENEMIIKIPPKIEIKNATGAGDAFIAALVYGYLNDFDLNEMTSFAIASSIIALQSEETISKDLNIENINKIIKEMKIC